MLCIWFIVSLSYTRLWFMPSVWLLSCDCGFHSVCPVMDEDKRLVEASWWEGLAVGKTVFCSDGQGPAQFSSVTQSCLTLATPWTSAHQTSLSITNSQSSPKLMSTESVMPSSHLILCCPFLLLPAIFPSISVFQMSQLFPSGGQNVGVSASTSVLPMNTQDWSPWGWTCWMSLQSKGLSRVFSNTTVQKHQFFGSAFFIVQLSHPYMTTGKIIALTRWTFVGKLMSLLFV